MLDPFAVVVVDVVVVAVGAAGVLVPLVIPPVVSNLSNTYCASGLPEHGRKATPGIVVVVPAVLPYTYEELFAAAVAFLSCVCAGKLFNVKEEQVVVEVDDEIRK